MAVRQTLSDPKLATSGGRLRWMRRMHGLTQELLASKVHCKQSSISQWENDMWLPSLSMQITLAEFFNVRRHDLFGDDA